ncbi:MAG: AMP-binding protein [Candidatus Rokubacteria bacterium]|nr:AMP-binding protein [Candidatus Rokubacteria bacterium]
MVAARSSDWFEKVAIGTLPERAARRWGTREALCFQGRRSTFLEIAAGVDRVARGLIALGVAQGDKVALWMLNRPEWIEAAFAVMKIGAVLVPVNTRLRTHDVGYILAQSHATTLILAERGGPVDYLAMVRELAPVDGAPGASRLPGLRRVLLLGEARRPATVAWADLLERADEVDERTLAARAAAVSPEDLAFLMYTSGTTGVPKGAMHAHRLVRNVTDRAFRLAITEQDVILMYLPLFHLFAFSEGMLASMVTGARQVLTETFEAAESLELLARERATVLHGFDTHFKELCEAHARQPREVSSVRTGILAAGMSSSVPVARRARALFGPLVSGYGMSEFGVGAAIGALDSTEEQSCEASGYPAPGYEIRVVDPASGRDQPTGAPGEILVRGYTLMLGYHHEPEATAAAIDADGWMHTGDMGLLRPDGHLRFMGRYKDMLKIGGENVDPMEVEAYLMSHPGIDSAAVVSYPDARLSEVGVAFVRRAPGGTLTEDDVLAHCRGRIASFKIPRHVLFVDDFPMTSSGKIQKVRLREEALRRLPPPRP